MNSLRTWPRYALKCSGRWRRHDPHRRSANRRICNRDCVDRSRDNEVDLDVSAFLLKFRNEDDGYSTVAGLRVQQMSINGDSVVVIHKESGGWRDLLSGAGVRSVSVSAAGIFLSGDSERLTREHALSGTLPDCELSFDNGERLRGKFLIQRLDYTGDLNDERNYSLQLESSGPILPASQSPKQDTQS